MRALLRYLLVTFSLLVTLSIGTALAQQTAPATKRPLKVAIRVLPPFVIANGDQYTGFSIDLWQAIAKTLDQPFSYVPTGPIQELMDSVASKQADLAITAISITSKREETFDFSQPMFDGGLQILTRADKDGGSSALWANLKNLLTSGIMPALWAILAALIIIPAHLVWWFERRDGKSIVHKSYFPGIFDALWWATGAAHGQQLDYPKSGVGRAMSGIAVFVSVIFIAFFTANVTTILTVQQLRGEINGLDDLKGRKIATTANSSAAEFLRTRDLTILPTQTIEQAYDLLQDKKVDAVVFDAPVLLYYAANQGRGIVEVVGQIFRKESYGIMFSQGNPLRKPVNEALLKLKEDGTYDILYRKWFGKGDKDN